MPLITRTLLLMALIAGLASCASRVDPMAITEGQTPVRLQNRLLLTPALPAQA